MKCYNGMGMALVNCIREALLQLLIQPFYYMAVILIALIYHRQLLQERKLFHVRMQSSITQAIRAVLGELSLV